MAKSLKDQILQGINQKLSQFTQPMRSPVPTPQRVTPYTSTIPGMINSAKMNMFGALSNVEQGIKKNARPLYDVAQATPRTLDSFKRNIGEQTGYGTIGTALGTGIENRLYGENRRKVLTDQAISLQSTARDFRAKGNTAGALRLEDSSRRLLGMVSNEANQYNEKAQTMSKQLPGAVVRGAASLVGADKITPINAALTATLSGGIAKLTGQDVPEAIGKGLASLPKTMGVVTFTNPVSQGAGNMAFGKLGNGILSQLTARGVTGMGNVVEDEIIQRIGGTTPANQDRILSFVLGAALSDSANKNMVRDVKAFWGQTKGLTPTGRKVAEEATVSAIGRMRDQYGKYMPEGEKWMSKVVPDIRVNNRLNETGEVSSRMLTDAGGAALGSLVGLDPQRDEQGNWKVGYNIPRGVSGAAIGALGADTFGTKVGATEVSGITGKITPELKPNADYARSFETYTDFRKALADQGRMVDFDNSVAKGGFTDPADFWKASLATKYSGPITEQLPMGMSAKPKGDIMDAQNTVSNSRTSSKPIPSENEKYAFSINKPRLGLNGKEAKKLDKVVEQIRPLLEKNKGKTLTHAEIVEAGRGAKMLGDVMGREESKKFAATLQASRNFLKTQSGKKGLSPEYLAQLEIVNSVAADAGRKLNAFGTMAEDATIKEKVLKDLLSLEGDTAAILKAGKNVNWDNAKEVTDFYRQFKPASIADKLAEFRYTNMLSSPNTHIVNTFSNILQTALITPVEKTIKGGLDFATSRLTGREQQYFARQGVDYAGGYWKSLPDAWGKFKDTISGAGGLNKPDINFIPTSTSKLQRAYTTPLRVLEASDQFFRTLTKGGEIASLKTEGITGAKAAKLAEESADYRTFRQAFDPEGKLGQGDLFKVWDKYNAQINRLRSLPGGNWIVPFLQTPTNILKQGVEYSPLGVVTMKGAKDPLGQLSKAIIGTTVFSGAYALANSGLTTWDAPTGADERAEFYAAGLQPYSVKMGDKWVSYSKLGPLSYPIAMASALKWAQDEGGQEDLLATAGKSIGGTLGFFADQSYVRGIGDFIDAARGDSFKQSRALTNIPAQLVPYRSFMGWVTRLVDPVYRKTSGGTIPEQIGKSLMSQVPGLSQNIEAYQTPFGEDSKRQFPLFNAVSPLSVTQEQGGAKEFYDARKEERDMNKQINQQIDSIESGGNKTTSGDIDLEGKRKIAKKKLEAGMDVSDDELILIHNVDKLTNKNPVTAVAKAKHEEDLFKKATDIYRDEDLDDESKRKLIDTLGVNNDDVLYYDLATENTMIKKVAINEEISTLLTTSKDRGELVRKLASYRREVSGEMVLSDTIITDLVSDGTISKEEGKVLKDTKYNTDGSLKVKVTGRGAGAKLKSIKTKRIKMSTKLPTIKSTSRKYSMTTPNLKVDTNGLKVKLPSNPKYAVKFNV